MQRDLLLSSVVSEYNGEIVTYPRRRSTLRCPIIYEKGVSIMYYPQNLLENANRFLKERKVQLGEVSLYRSAMALGRDL